MTTAAVGFQCPECVRAGQVGTVPTRTPVGGRFQRDGLVTYSLIGVCVGLFVLVSTAGLLGGNGRWGMWPVGIALQDQWTRLFTAMFLHGGILHIGFNMYVLYLLGPPLERMLGHRRFLVLFLISGLGGSVASYTFSPLNTLSVGASGAIFGVMAAMIVVGRRLGYDMGQVAMLFGINVVLGFVLGGIDWRAHLGGAAVGALLGYILSYGGRTTPAQRQRVLIIQAAAAAVVLLGLAAVVLWRTAELRSLVGA
ncbi:MAG: rhomboid family intramembrane serine protease [Candidatus Nanopelagicales bacterium]